jgi:hypothetical protein
LGADASIIAASGWGISSDLSGNTANVLPAIFGNALGGQATPAWDFTPRPAAVLQGEVARPRATDGLLGTGCDWHPNAAEHQRMATLLEAELRTDLGW